MSTKRAKKLQFKFREGTSADRREDLAEDLRRHGATEVRPLFSDVDEDELETLYIAQCEDDSVERELFELLEKSECVEFVEPEVRRKLV